MSGIWTGSLLTMEFRHEYEAERDRWLRRRFLWYSGVVGGLNVLWVLGALALWGLAVTLEGSGAPGVIDMLADGALAAVFLLTLRHAMRRPMGRQAILSLTFWLIVVSGAVRLTQGVMGIERGSPVEGGLAASVVVGVGGAAALLPAHLFACLFLPWTARESFRPLVPLLVLNALVSIWYVQSVWVTGAVIAISPLIGAPGALICWWRHSRFHDRFNMQMLRRRYSELKRDLVNARQIHESLFPQALEDGPVRMAYLYEPMRQIGGDYLYAQRSRSPSGETLNIVLIDVTGHGIPAALTVNRLHGELERIFAEAPESSPGEVLRLLNRYVHLTLATHAVYATAFCAQVREDSRALLYASAGHPPAFVRAVHGTIDRLDSTTFLLGAVAGEEFDPAQREVPFGDGDALIACTDGALEVRDREGRMLGIDGLLRIIASSRVRPGRWAETILRVVDEHRSGAIADDTLIVEVWRPLVQELRSRERIAAGVGAGPAGPG